MVRLCLNLASGDDPKVSTSEEKWINIDLYDTSLANKPDYNWERQDVIRYLSECESNTIDEIYSKWFFEHVSFLDEKSLWENCYRVLKPHGKINIYVPDFEYLCKLFLNATDEFKDFYKLCPKSDSKYGFGHGNDTNFEGGRWGTMISHFYGNQAADGQFHKTAYTAGRIYDIMVHVGFCNVIVTEIMERGILNLDAIGYK